VRGTARDGGGLRPRNEERRSRSTRFRRQKRDAGSVESDGISFIRVARKKIKNKKTGVVSGITRIARARDGRRDRRADGFPAQSEMPERGARRATVFPKLDARPFARTDALCVQAARHSSTSAARSSERHRKGRSVHP